MASVFNLIKTTSKISKMTDSFNRNLKELESAADADSFFQCFNETAAAGEEIYDTSEQAGLYAGSESAERMLKELQDNKTRLLNGLIDRAAAAGNQDTLHALAETYRDEMTAESLQHLQEMMKDGTAKG